MTKSNNETSEPKAQKQKEQESQKTSILKQAVTMAKEKAEEFKKTKAGKATTVWFGKFGTRVSAIAAATAALAAASGPAAIVPLAFGLGTIAVGIVADFMDVRNTRLLKKENDMLAKFADSRLK